MEHWKPLWERLFAYSMVVLLNMEAHMCKIQGETCSHFGSFTTLCWLLGLSVPKIKKGTSTQEPYHRLAGENYLWNLFERVTRVASMGTRRIIHHRVGQHRRFVAAPKDALRYACSRLFVIMYEQSSSTALM